MQALNEEPEDHMKSATAWSIGQVGRHTSDHAKAVADTGVLPLLVTLENDAHSSEDLKTKCRKALKAVVAKLTNLPALDMLVHRWGHTRMRGPLQCLWGCPCSTLTAQRAKLTQHACGGQAGAYGAICTVQPVCMTIFLPAFP